MVDERAVFEDVAPRVRIPLIEPGLNNVGVESASRVPIVIEVEAVCHDDTRDDMVVSMNPKKVGIVHLSEDDVGKSVVITPALKAPEMVCVPGRRFVRAEAVRHHEILRHAVAAGKREEPAIRHPRS